MAWIEKAQPTPFDAQPIEGLFFMDGDRFAQRIGRDWTAGQKYAMVAFPSGEAFALWESAHAEHGGILHIFGEMDLPLKHTRDQACTWAREIAEQCGYSVREVGDNGLEVWGHDDQEHFLIAYDDDEGRMRDIVPLPYDLRDDELVRFAIEVLGGVVASPPDLLAERPPHPALDLLPDAVREKLPPLYSGEEQGLEVLAPVKYFTPDAQWSWWASEGSAVISNGEDTQYIPLHEEPPAGWEVVDHLFFGLVSGLDVELGYFALSDLKRVRGSLGLPVERDLYYEPVSLRELMDRQQREGGR